MEEQFSRIGMLIGEDGLERLKNSRVAVFGVGGVGGYVVEALVRSGIGEIDIIDNDVVCESNLNRQIIATRDTIGMLKVDAFRERILSINPNCRVNTYSCFYLPETENMFDFSVYNYIVDAIDTVSAKISLVMKAKEANVPIICSMGTGNKLDPTRLELADIYDTSVCPLARVMRKELKDRGIKKLTVLYSKETPIKPKRVSAEGKVPDKDDEAKDGLPVLSKEAKERKRKATPGSTGFVPSVAGLIIASRIVRDIVGVL